jgi:predicted RNase H-like HicB family nuclease
MEFPVIIERGELTWGAYAPDLPGCVAVGESEDEVRELMREAIALHLEAMREQGQAIPQPSKVLMVAAG